MNAKMEVNFMVGTALKWSFPERVNRHPAVVCCVAPSQLREHDSNDFDNYDQGIDPQRSRPHAARRWLGH